MKCFNYLRCGSSDLSNGKAVLLFCDCLVALCPSCAREQLPNNGLYLDNALICCPKCNCKATYEEHKVIINGGNAMATEEALIRRAIAHTDLEYSGKDMIKNFIKLQACWIKLNEIFRPKLDIEEKPEPSNKDGSRDRAVVRLRYKIARLAKKSFPDMQLPYPLDMVTFTKNKVIERYLDLQVNPVAANKVYELAECNMCCHCIVPGESVQLACECNVNLCRNCALFNTAYKKSTYTEGIHCPHCGSSCRALLSNIEYTQQCETALLRSAQQYLTKMLVEIPTNATTDASRKGYIKALKLYACLGLNGNINLTDDRELGRQSNAQLRLEIARLEEMRLNKAGLLNTYTYNGDSAPPVADCGNTDTYGSFQIGFLHSLKVKKNTFFEHLFLHQSAEQVTTPSANMQECERKTALYLPQLQKLLKNKSGPINAMEKIIVVAMYVDKYTDGGDFCSSDYNATQVLLLVESYLQNPALQYEPMFGGQLFKDVIAFLRKRFTIEGTAVIMRKLSALGWVDIVTDSAGREAYAMQYYYVKFDGFEPGLVSSMDRASSAVPLSRQAVSTSSASHLAAAASGAPQHRGGRPAGTRTSRLASQPVPVHDDGSASDGNGSDASDADDADSGDESGSDDGSEESGEESGGTQEDEEDDEEGSDVEMSVQSDGEGNDSNTAAAAGASVQVASPRAKSSAGAVVSPPAADARAKAAVLANRAARFGGVPLPASPAAVDSLEEERIRQRMQRFMCARSNDSTAACSCGFHRGGDKGDGDVGTKRKQTDETALATVTVVSNRASNASNVMPTTKRLRGSQHAQAAATATVPAATSSTVPTQVSAPTPFSGLRTVTADANNVTSPRSYLTAAVHVSDHAVVRAAAPPTCTPPKGPTCDDESPAQDVPSIIHPDLQLKLKASIDAVEAVTLRSMRTAAALKADNERLQQELTQLKEQHAQKEATFEAKRDAQWEEMLSLKKQLNEAARKASAAAEKWAADGAVLEASLTAKEKQITVHEARLAQMETQLKGLQGANKTLEGKLAPLALENKQLTNQLSQSQGNYSAARDERDTLRTRVQALQKSNTELKESAVKVQALEKKLIAQEKSIQEERVANDAVQNTLTPLLRENEKLKAEKNEVSAEKDRLKSYVEGLGEELKRTRKQLNDALEAHASLRVEFQETHDELADIKSRKKRDEKDIQKLMFGLGGASTDA